MITRRALLTLMAAVQPRRFPLGLYQLPQSGDRAAALREVKDAGFDFIHASPTRAALDEAAKYGLQAWCTVGSDPAKIRKIVAELRDHPALRFWETEDEPSYQWRKPGVARVSPQAIRAAYALLKQLDSRPVYLNHSPTNLVSTLQAYNPGGDILATDVYPVIPHGIREQYGLWEGGRHGDLLNTHISQLGAYVDKLQQVAGPQRQVWMVLQAFAWEMLRRDARDAKMVLYPNVEQLWFMACQSIVHGATGLIWWGLEFTPATAPLWGDLAGVVRRLRTLNLEDPVETSIQIDYHDTGHSLDRGIEWKAFRRNVIAVNADPNPVEATVERVGRVSMPPFGVAIWRR